MSFLNYLKEQTDFMISEYEENRLESIFLFACLCAANKDEKLVKTNKEVKVFLKDLVKFQEDCKTILGKKLEFLKDSKMIDLSNSFEQFNNEDFNIDELMNCYINITKYQLTQAMLKLNFIEVITINKLIEQLLNTIQLADIFSKLNSESIIINKEDIKNGIKVPFL
jgi:hypothetical protein